MTSAAFEMDPSRLDSAAPTEMSVLSGALLDLAAPDWQAVAPTDIAHALSVLPRWNGMRRRQISVLEHSLAVWAAAPPALKLEALLHDAHEAYTGDITRPMQRAIAFHAPDGARAIKRIQHRLDVAIARRVITDSGASVGLIELEAEILAESMRDGPLLAVDDRVLRAEFAEDQPEAVEAWERETWDREYRRRGAVAAWLAAVPFECLKRYARESTEPSRTGEEKP